MAEFIFDDTEVNLTEDKSVDSEVSETITTKEDEIIEEDNTELPSDMNYEYIIPINTDIVLKYSIKTEGIFEKKRLIEFEINELIKFKSKVIIVSNKVDYPLNKNDGEIVDSFELDSNMFEKNIYKKELKDSLSGYLSLFFEDYFLYQYIRLLPIYN